jgi:hypothetical protein
MFAPAAHPHRDLSPWLMALMRAARACPGGMPEAACAARCCLCTQAARTSCRFV